MGHGYSNYGTGKPKDGNGNGFKAGSSKTGVRHTIRNCVAWKNKASGFYANHSSGGNDWFNNTAYMNGTAFNMWASTWDANDNRTDGVVLKGSKAHVMKNNIAFPNKTAYIGGEYAAGEYNTWNLNITPKESDFVSVSDPSMTVTGKELGPLGGAFGPRQADGSLPDIDFLKLAKNSQMIDKGVNVGLKYEGKAPDLGAYEYGYVAPVIANMFTADPAGLVYNDTMYIFTGHDEAPAGHEGYIMNDWHIFSSGDMDTWVDRGAVLSIKSFKWARGSAWASQTIERNGKFYWYVTVHDGRDFAVGVAVADHPAGPYKDAIGKALITSDLLIPLFIGVCFRRSPSTGMERFPLIS